MDRQRVYHPRLVPSPVDPAARFPLAFPMNPRVAMSTKKILVAALLLTPIGLGAFTRPESAATPVPEAAEYSLDATHSSVIFKVKHLGASWFYGRFNGISGKIEVDEKDPAKSSVLFQIDAASVDTKNDKLDTHLKSPDFLDAAQFPEIVFESESVKKGKAKDSLEVTGKLTLRGVTKPLTLTVEKVGAGDARGKPVVGYHTSFTIDRTDFGVSYGADNGGVGKEVELTISAEAYGE
jgi:polyisoprenoid-binding protein YceI